MTARAVTDAVGRSVVSWSAKLTEPATDSRPSASVAAPATTPGVTTGASLIGLYCTAKSAGALSRPPASTMRNWKTVAGARLAWPSGGTKRMRPASRSARSIAAERSATGDQVPVASSRRSKRLPASVVARRTPVTSAAPSRSLWSNIDQASTNGVSSSRPCAPPAAPPSATGASLTLSTGAVVPEVAWLAWPSSST